MEIFRVSRPKFEKVRDRLECMEYATPTMWTAAQFVPAASRVYRSLKEAGAEPQIMQDFETLCDATGIPYVWFIDSDQEIAKEILKQIDARAAEEGLTREEHLTYYMEHGPEYAEQLHRQIREATEILRRQDDEPEAAIAVWTRFAEEWGG